MAQHRRNSLYGLVGFVIPNLVLLASYPVLVAYLGAEALGVYILAMTLAIGWSALDFGVAAATVKRVSEDKAKSDHQAVADVIAVSLIFYGLLGLIIGTALWFLSPLLAELFLVSDALRDDSIVAFRLTAIRFAAFFITTVFTAVFKGLYRFEFSTIMLTVLSITTFGGAAVAVVVADVGLVGISWIALVANVVVLVLSAILAVGLCRRHEIYLSRARPTWATARRIFHFGLYMWLNWCAGALVTHVARMILAAVLGPAALAVFTIASTLSIRAISAFDAMFEFLLPAASAFSQNLNAAAAAKLKSLYRRSQMISAGLSVVGFGILAGFAPTLMRWWLPAEVETEVAQILRILCAGVAIGAISRATYHLINGLDRPATNTLVLVVWPTATYASLLAFSLNGLTLEEFAVSQATGFFLYGVTLLAFSELVVWKRWIPKAISNAGASAQTD